MLSDKEYYNSLTRKTVGAGALFFNEKGELLIVKPTYREYWLLPGGIVEGDESPMDSCIREVKEEISLDIKNPEFVCVDYVPAYDEKPEFLHFVFNCGVLNEAQIGGIKLQQQELSEYRFTPVAEAVKMLSVHAGIRVSQAVEAMKNKQAIYIQYENH